MGNPGRSYDGRDVSKIRVSIDDLVEGGGSTEVAGKVLDRLKEFAAAGGEVVRNFGPVSAEGE